MVLAAVADVSTAGLVIGGIVASLMTAATTGYSAFRTAKHEADVRDEELLRTQLDRANQRIADLEAQVEEWRVLATSNRPDAS